MSSWEPRPENDTANHTAPTNPQDLANFSQWNATWNATYKPRIDGNFQGTTDEIIQWAACKWGWSDDLIRAEAVQESSWRQSTAGDGGNSFGLLQIKWNYHPAGSGEGRSRFELAELGEEHRVRSRPAGRRDARLLRRHEHVPGQHQG